MKPMAGRTMVVTGATGGIGKATARGLALLGAHLAVIDRDPQRTEKPPKKYVWQVAEKWTP
jgi:retinol dehydrogenase 14